MPSPQPTVFFFDMDHTLIANDCDVSWITFLVRERLAPADSLEQADRFFQLYAAGKLPLEDFFAFQFARFKGRTPAAMAPLVERHFTTLVRDRIYPQARKIVAAALATGRPVVLLTATNEVVAAPLAAYLQIPHLIGTRLELHAGRYTGRIAGAYCGGTGKIGHAEAFCRNHPGCSLAEAAYYGDSANDIPLLERVGFPHAVNPGDTLRAAAQARGWTIDRFTKPHF